MTKIFDDPTEFADDLLDGFVAANRQYVARVDGGVVRSTVTPRGQVAVVIGGGSGHYPAFAGLVGPGLATASACGNIFASPAVAQVYRVAKLADRGGGILLSYGNYAGDVLNFDEAQERLRAEGIDVRTVIGTDDIASGSIDEIAKRRGIAGELTLFKIAGAAAEAGHTLDEVERLARKANDRTRTLGVAFAGCTLPGASEPLFTVPDGEMSIGLGIHGEPGISSQPMPSASELAQLLVERLLAERPDGAGTRVVPILNGLGTVKYDELFVLFGRIAKLLEAEGLEIVEPECGEIVTSLDMSGLSLSLFWIDDELATLWSAPADTPAYRKGSLEKRERMSEAAATATAVTHEDATPASVALAGTVATLLAAIEDTIVTNADDLGKLDAIAGDGDHGIGMSRGVRAGASAAAKSVADKRGVHETVMAASDEWSERAGGTSGALWAAAIAAVANSLGNRESYDAKDASAAARAALEAITTRGKAVLGDKTMVDAFDPYVRALEAAIAGGEPLNSALTSAARVATEAAEGTAGLKPRLGRARPLAEKSLGHPDAGAVSFALIVTRIAAEFA
ncbi:MAG: D-erythrulose 4-kinase [Actinomycetota bacterium]|nr:dhaL [Glaciihabitans sp.]MDQ1542451.1 D-erythrulose 4-kinase [Actinomycetota bacterium]